MDQIAANRVTKRRAMARREAFGALGPLIVLSVKE